MYDVEFYFLIQKETSIPKLHAFHNFTGQKLPQVPLRIEFACMNLFH